MNVGEGVVGAAAATRTFERNVVTNSRCSLEGALEGAVVGSEDGAGVALPLDRSSTTFTSRKLLQRLCIKGHSSSGNARNERAPRRSTSELTLLYPHTFYAPTVRLAMSDTRNFQKGKDSTRMLVIGTQQNTAEGTQQEWMPLEPLLPCCEHVAQATCTQLWAAAASHQRRWHGIADCARACTYVHVANFLELRRLIMNDPSFRKLAP